MTMEPAKKVNGQDLAEKTPAEKRRRAGQSRAQDTRAVADLLSPPAGADKLEAGRDPLRKRQGGGEPEKKDPPLEKEPAGEPEKKEPQGEPAGDDTLPGGEPAGEPEGKKAKARGLADVAELAGMTLEELYALEIPLSGDRGKFSLGQVKDYLQDHGLAAVEYGVEVTSARKAREEAEEQRERVTGEALATRRELAGILAAMPGVPRAVLAAVREAQGNRMQRELSLALDSAPEWKDPRAFAADREDMAKILRPYGFTKMELEQIDDSRLLLFLRSLVRARRAAAGKLKDAGLDLGEQPGEKRPKSEPSSASRGAGVRPGVVLRKAGGRESKVQAVGALLSKLK